MNEKSGKPRKTASIEQIVAWHEAQIAAHIREIAKLMPAHGPSVAFDALDSSAGLMGFYLQAVTNPRN